MASNSFLLVSLEESKAKQLAQIVSNDVCRRILDYLAAKGKEATETEISKELRIPLSTVHYNLKQLLQSGIAKAEEFHYSEKGREVLHYSLANKYIIIAPTATATEGLSNKLKRILPVVFVVAAAGVAIQLFSSLQQGTIGRGFAAPYAAQRTLEQGVVQKAAEAPAIAAQAAQGSLNAAVWFVAGALFALVVYLIYDIVRERRQR